MYLGWEALEGKLSVTWPSLSSSLAPENKSGPFVPSDRQLIPCNVMTWKPGPIIIPILQMRKRRHRKINYLAFTTHLLSSRAQMQLKELVSRAHTPTTSLFALTGRVSSVLSQPGWLRFDPSLCSISSVCPPSCVAVQNAPIGNASQRKEDGLSYPDWLLHWLTLLLSAHFSTPWKPHFSFLKRGGQNNHRIS